MFTRPQRRGRKVGNGFDMHEREFAYTEVRFRGEIVLDAATEGEVDAFVRGLRGECGTASGELSSVFRGVSLEELKATHAEMVKLIGAAANDVPRERVRRWCAFVGIIERRMHELDPRLWCWRGVRSDNVNGAGMVDGA